MIKEFLQKAIVNGNKSTILLPLRWLIGLSFSAILIAEFIDSSKWIKVMFGIICGLSIILFLFAYVYSLIKNPENLRSEKYTIQRMAIERGIFGDDITGQIKIETEKDIKEFGDTTSKVENELE